MVSQPHPTARTYLVIYGWLIGLTALEVGVVLAGWSPHLLPLPEAALRVAQGLAGQQQVGGWPQGAIVTLLVATALAKALLIALYFMHLKFDRPVVWLLPGIPVVLGVIFIAALFPDIVFHLPAPR